MDFLKTLHRQAILQLESEDMSGLPADVQNDIKRSIREGAADLDQKWANALELVHTAFKVNGVQRPTPDMRSGWSQYEELLQFAVQQLSKVRGMQSDWRMSSSMFHEAMKPGVLFKVTVSGKGSMDSKVVKSENIDVVINSIKEKNREFTADVHKKSSDKHAVVTFSKHGVKQNMSVKIEQINDMPLNRSTGLDSI